MSSQSPQERRQRIEDWKTIRNIAESFSAMSVEVGSYEPDTNDIQSHLRLSSPEEARGAFQEMLGDTPLPKQSLDIMLRRRQVLFNQVQSAYLSTSSRTQDLPGCKGQSQTDGIRKGLERWFLDAEQDIMAAIIRAMEDIHQVKSNSTGRQSDSSSILIQAFAANASPNDKERETLARACGMSYKQVTTWFQNRRQRAKSRILQQNVIVLSSSPNPEGNPQPTLPICRPLPRKNKKAIRQNDHFSESKGVDKPSDAMISETRNTSLLFRPEAQCAPSSDALVFTAGPKSWRMPGEKSTTSTSQAVSISASNQNVGVDCTLQRKHMPLPPLTAASTFSLASSTPFGSRPFAIAPSLPPLTITPRLMPDGAARGVTTGGRKIRSLPKTKAKPKPKGIAMPAERSSLSHGVPTLSTDHRLLTSQPLPTNSYTSNHEQYVLRVPSLTRSVSSASNSTEESDASSDDREAPSFSHGPQHGSQGISSYPHTVLVPLSRERGTAQWTASSGTGFATPMHSKWEASSGHEHDRTPTQQRFNQQATYSSPTAHYQTSRFGSSTYLIPQRDAYQLMTSQAGSQFWVATSDLVPTATNPPQTIHRHSNEQELRVVSNSLPMISQEVDETKQFLTSVTSQSSDSTPSPYLEGGGELNAYIVNEALERLSRETSLLQADGYSFSFDEISDLSGKENLMDVFTLKDMEALLSLSATPEPAPGRNVSPGSDITVALPGLSSSESSPNTTHIITPQTSSMDKGKNKEGSPDQNPEQVATVKTESVNEDAWVTPESTTLDSFFTGAEWEWGLLPFNMPGVDEVFTLCTESV